MYRAVRRGNRTERRGDGIIAALVSAAGFGLSGSFATSLLEKGWSPGAAVTARIGVASAVLILPALRAMHGRWSLIRSNIRSIVTFGAVAVAGSQFCYFNAVDHLSVGVALMIEYMGLVLVVAWQWFASQRRPLGSTLVGVTLALAGLMLVLDVFGGFRIDPIGVLWGTGAAIGLAGYFIVASSTSNDLPPIAMATAGMVAGAILLVALGLVGVLPLRFSTQSVHLARWQTPWWAAVAGLGSLSGALAYATGISSARRLGAKLSAFVGLTEVMFAVLFAWVLVGELPSTVQILGGLLILSGIVVVRREEFNRPAPGSP